MPKQKSTAEKLRDREAWLIQASTEMGPWFEKQGYDLPSHRMSIGFPSTGRKGKVVAECWDSKASDDRHCEIFIHPKTFQAVDVLANLAHELVHAAVGAEAKHGKIFKKVANGIGLEGPMKATVPGEELTEKLEALAKKLGPFPHARLNTDGGSPHKKPQKGRMLKAECPVCKYIIRASKSCFEIGVPPCPNLDCEMSWQNALENDSEIVPMIAYMPEDADGEQEEG